MSILESPLIDWAIFSSTIQLIVKGLLIGIIVSAPMGPVGVLCIQRTMHRGRNVGLVTGLGASLSDLIYAIITGAGMTLVMSFVEQEQNIYWMKIGGSAILFGFGLHTLLSNPLKAIRRSKHKRGSLVHNFITSFFLTLSNPLIIFLFIALFAQLTFTVPQNPFGAFWGYMSIFGGAMLWWGGLTYLITRMKNSFGYRGMIVLNRTIGVIVLTVSVIYAFLTLFHIQVRIPISS
ncbi:LysE family translocator [Alloprevotella sp. oral taxon 473]|jgi:putative membrane protein|uniref:LysE family translocator n=1 Tax=Alloprevotella sp. oral taxon 473 TaxID=712469 RepID=UPI0002A1B975|nr:LysE family transporter [Alloprevotella sp. oral taxon 473]EKX90442.1 translocator protein, LysE family [Alloprevotella sp. oral taxon 473 str. F0040]